MTLSPSTPCPVSICLRCGCKAFDEQEQCIICTFHGRLAGLIADGVEGRDELAARLEMLALKIRSGGQP